MIKELTCLKTYKVLQSDTIDEAYSMHSAFISFKRTFLPKSDTAWYETSGCHFTFKLLDGDQVIDDERKLAFTMSFLAFTS